MSVKKMKDGKRWYVSVRYKDWNGTTKQHKKEGFARQADAKEYERTFLERKKGTSDMTVSSLCQIYLEDCRKRMKVTTCSIKEFILGRFVDPLIGQVRLDQLTPAMIRSWQGQLLDLSLSPGYLRMIGNQTSALFNFGVRYYGLRENPCRLAGPIGKRGRAPVQFWTVAEFSQFLSACPDPINRTMFSLLFWTGMRVGELLALTYEDFDLDARTVRISKTYHRIKGQDTITPPKTEKSNRVIDLPQFLADMVQQYATSIYDLNPAGRLFPVTDYSVRNRLKRYCEKSGVKQIRVHDLRHSHASFLIEHEFSPLLIAERLGHDKVETTLGTYSHLYPNKQSQVVQKIEEIESCYDFVTISA